IHHYEDEEARKNDLLIIAVQLGDGAILAARLPVRILSPHGLGQSAGRRGFGGRHFPTLTAAPFSSVLLSTLLVLLAGIILLTWIGVRIATRPLSKLSEAALALSEDPERPPLEPVGPTEVVQATNAFNQMQKRLVEHIHERTHILAAISHDLQTPITRLRLRAEMVDDEHLKTRIQSDLDAMQSLIREGLAYARSMEVTAPPQPIDLNALLAALCNDAVDMGWAVSVAGLASAPFVGQVVALRRALWNLIENGVKFGITVDIVLSETPDAFRIVVHDHGPGLPAEEMERVFEPFYRTESSRNRETGGTGLGLAITRNLLHVQRGSVNLHNSPEGGLVATVILPRG
ncbi:MAG: HAMP domain-containing protein, partial [Azoarcus sp.]|nr:HAMP domain-containing protein [Azoarcus sp.]